MDFIGLENLCYGLLMIMVVWGILVVILLFVVGNYFVYFFIKINIWEKIFKVRFKSWYKYLYRYRYIDNFLRWKKCLVYIYFIVLLV